MLNTIQNTNFKSRIILSSAKYERKPLKALSKAGKYVGYPWTMGEAKYLSEGYSDAASVCTIGVLKAKNENIGYLFHSIPSNNFEKVTSAIITAADSLQERAKAGSGLEGFLTGGNILYRTSILQYERLMELFDNLKIRYSALLGAKKEESYVNMHYSSSLDEYTLETPFLYQPKGSNDLTDNFSIVKIDPKDKISIE